MTRLLRDLHVRYKLEVLPGDALISNCSLPQDIKEPVQLERAYPRLLSPEYALRVYIF